MIVTTRIPDQLVIEIDRLAMAYGQTRAAWLARVIAEAAVAPEAEKLSNIAPHSRGHRDDQIRISIRFDRREIKAIEEAGAPLGLTRLEWIKRAVRRQLWGSNTGIV